MLLYQRIVDKYGDGGDDDGCKFDLCGKPHLLKHDFAFAACRSVEKSVQHRLHRIKLTVDVEDVCVDIVVPVSDGVEEDHDAYDGLCDGQDKVEEYPYLARSVYRRRLEDLVGYVGLEEGFAHKHVVYAHAAADDEDQRVLIEPERPTHDDVRHEAAAKEHGDDKHDHDKFSKRQIAS